MTLEDLKEKFWNGVRPLHSPFTKAMRKRLGREYFSHPEMELPPPYDAIQIDVERHLHQYLHVNPQQISRIIIVGAHEAGEVQRLRSVYSRASFLCFEPHPVTHQRLAKSFSQSPHVTISNLALSDRPGRTRFYDMDMPGNGSLLEPDVEGWMKSNNRAQGKVSSFEVTVSTLDREAASFPIIDLLWMDVQGAEGRVLDGGTETLTRVKAVFLEVALTGLPYQGAVSFPEIAARLQRFGFTCVGLGVGAWNGVGNALFIKGFENLVHQPFE